MLGRATATMRVATFGVIPLAAVFGGWLAESFGLRAPFILGGAVVGVTGLVVGRWLTATAIEQARAAARVEPIPRADQGTA